jgi:hypothetical protein
MPYGVDRLIDLKRQASKPHRVSCIGAVVALLRPFCKERTLNSPST